MLNRMILVKQERRGSPRPDGTRKMDLGPVPGFHPGLFSLLPSGKRAVAGSRCFCGWVKRGLAGFVLSHPSIEKIDGWGTRPFDRMKMVVQKGRGSPRPYWTRKLYLGAVPGFHPGLFSFLPSGKRAVCLGRAIGPLLFRVVPATPSARHPVGSRGASIRRIRRARGGRAPCPACGGSWRFWRLWPRWDRNRRAQCRGRGESRCGARPKIVRREMDGSGQRKGVGDQFQRMAEINDVDLLAGIELLLQLLGLQAGGDELLEDHPATDRRGP